MRGMGIGLLIAWAVLCLAPGSVGAEERFADPAASVADPAASPVDTGAIDATPADAAAEGAVVPVPAEPSVDGRPSEIERAWFSAGPTPRLRAAGTRRRALELGERSLEPAARALVALDDRDHAVDHARLAVKLAPDLPLARTALAAAYWDEGEYRGSLAQTFAALLAIPRHLEASLWVVGSIGIVLAAVLIVGSIGFIVAVGLSGFARAAHDLGDLVSTQMPGFARAALLVAIVGVPLALGEGALGLLLCLLAIGIVYGGSRHRAVLAMSVVLLLIGLYPMLQLGAMALDALDSDPVATASLAVVRNGETPAQVAILREAELQGDTLAARVLAVRTLRRGDTEGARNRFLHVYENDTADALVLAALGNMAFRDGRTEEAIGFYERAARIEATAVLLFDLSQAYARAFRMEEFENALQRAQALDAELVDELSAIGDPDFVAELAFPIAPIRSRMFSAADGDPFVNAVVHGLAPGRLGESPLHLAGAFAVVFLISLLIMNRYQHAGRCARCGVRICARCDDSMWSAEMCDGCHHLFNRPQGTDPQLRMARLKALRSREGRIEKLATAASALVPGAAGLLAKRPDLAFVSILFFCGAAACFLWRDGVVPDPLAIGPVGHAAFLVVGSVSVLLYAGLILTGIVIRRSQ